MYKTLKLMFIYNIRNHKIIMSCDKLYIRLFFSFIKIFQIINFVVKTSYKCLTFCIIVPVL